MTRNFGGKILGERRLEKEDKRLERKKMHRKCSEDLQKVPLKSMV